MNTWPRVIEAYGHNGRIGVLVEFQLRNDVTALTSEFTAFARDVAVHIAVENPASLEALLQQRFAKDATKSVRSLVAATSHTLGESISVVRFVRWDNEQEIGQDPEPPLRTAAALRKHA